MKEWKYLGSIFINIRKIEKEMTCWLLAARGFKGIGNLLYDKVVLYSHKNVIYNSSFEPLLTNLTELGRRMDHQI